VPECTSRSHTDPSSMATATTASLPGDGLVRVVGASQVDFTRLTQACLSVRFTPTTHSDNNLRRSPARSDVQRAGIRLLIGSPLLEPLLPPLPAGAAGLLTCCIGGPADAW
jgi:hypothetical protein